MEENKMKKVFSLVLAIIMCLSVLSVCVFADDSASNAPMVYSGDALTSAYLKVSGNGDVTAPTYENGYYRLTGGTGASSTQLYFTLASEVDGSVYKYMVIKYRYAENYSKAGISVNRWGFVDSSKGTDVTVTNSRSVDGQIATYADGEWQVAIIDMTAISFEAKKENNVLYAQGKTWANYKYNKEISIMPYGWNGVEGSVFDLEYFGFFTSGEEANKYVSGTSGIVINSFSNMVSTSSDTNVTYNDDGFFRFEYKTGGGSGYIGAKFKAPVDFKGSTYKYMAIKYRYDKEYSNAGISIYRNDITGTDANNNNTSYKISSRSKDGQIATVDDGQWQTTVIDMSAISFEGQKYDKTNYPNAIVGEGKTWDDYTYSQISILPFGWNRPEGAQFDLEYVGFFKTEEEAKTYAGIPIYEDTATGYTYDAARLDLVYKMNTSNSINATIKASDDESYVTLTTNQTSGAKAGRLYIPLGEGFDVTTQKYFAIKYRYNDNKLLADMQLMRAIKSDASNPLSRVKDGSFTTVTDGDGWQTIVIDLTTVEWDNDLFVGKTWSQHALDGIYLMPWGGAATNGATVDIAVLGFSDTENNARAIVGLEPVAENTPTDNPTDTGDDTEDTTGASDTEDTTGASNTDNTTESTDATTEPVTKEKKGCGSSLSYSGIVFVVVIGAAVLTIFKKKEYNC